MTDRMSFEDRLEAAYERYLHGAPRDIDPYVVARAALATGGRGRLDRVGRVFDTPALRLAAALVVLLLALAAAVIIGSALQREPPLPIVQGEFTLVGPPAREDLDVYQAVVPDDERALLFGLGTESSTGRAFGFIDIFDPETGVVTLLDDSRVARRWNPHGIVRLADGRVLVTGGRQLENENLRPSELIDPDTGEITAVGQMVYPRTDHTATLLHDGRVLIAGGGNAQRSGDLPTKGDPPAELFDPATGTFSAIGLLHHSRAGHRATLLNDGRVLITGGSGADGTLAEAEIFDPATESFDVVVGRHSRVGHSATLLDDGRVLLVGGDRLSVDAGGFVSGDTLTSAELFDPATGDFTEAGLLTTERAEHAAVLLADGRVLIAGGYNSLGYPSTTELFDPASGTFARGANTLDRLGSTDAVPLRDGHVLVVGERGRFELFDPAPVGRAAAIPRPRDGLAGTVTTVESPAVERIGHTATLMPDGRVLVVVGTETDPRSPLDSAEIYDPGTGHWSATGSLHVARAFHTAALLADGRVLVVGGQVPVTESDGSRTYGPIDAAEVYDPATGTFTSIGLMSLPRAEQLSATVLPDGRVLITGGTDKPGLDLFDPRTNAFAAVTAYCQGDSVLLPDGRVLIGCGQGLVFDPATDWVAPADPTWLGDVGTRLPDGRILFTDTLGSHPLVLHPEFDPAEAFPWSAMAGFNEVLGDRSGIGASVQTITPLHDGRSLVFASQRDDTTHPLRHGLALVFDPNLVTFTEVASPTGRFANTATMLQDGRILFVGKPVRSPDRTDPEPPVAEIFDLGLPR
jgi:Galactose oxidase, central domain